MQVTGKKVLVVGAARSGIASAKFLMERGAVVALHDQKPLEKWSEEAVLLKQSGVGLLPGDVPTWLLDQLDLVVVSPGVPATIIPIRYAERAGAEVIGTGTGGRCTTLCLL